MARNRLLDSSYDFMIFFFLQSMNQRVYGYENMASNARLRQYLSAKGGYLATSDFIGSRLAELKGFSPSSSPKHR